MKKITTNQVLETILNSTLKRVNTRKVNPVRNYSLEEDNSYGNYFIQTFVINDSILNIQVQQDAINRSFDCELPDQLINYTTTTLREAIEIAISVIGGNENA